jgi:hypothetical protein
MPGVMRSKIIVDKSIFFGILFTLFVPHEKFYAGIPSQINGATMKAPSFRVIFAVILTVSIIGINGSAQTSNPFKNYIQLPLPFQRDADATVVGETVIAGNFALPTGITKHPATTMDPSLSGLNIVTTGNNTTNIESGLLNFINAKFNATSSKIRVANLQGLQIVRPTDFASMIAQEQKGVQNGVIITSAVVATSFNVIDEADSEKDINVDFSPTTAASTVNPLATVLVQLQKALQKVGLDTTKVGIKKTGAKTEVSFSDKPLIIAVQAVKLQTDTSLLDQISFLDKDISLLDNQFTKNGTLYKYKFRDIPKADFQKANLTQADAYCVYIKLTYPLLGINEDDVPYKTYCPANQMIVGPNLTTPFPYIQNSEYSGTLFEFNSFRNGNTIVTPFLQIMQKHDSPKFTFSIQNAGDGPVARLTGIRAKLRIRERKINLTELQRLP